MDRMPDEDEERRHSQVRGSDGKEHEVIVDQTMKKMIGILQVRWRWSSACESVHCSEGVGYVGTVTVIHG